ncbi:MAG: efflux RND transporter permease subunit [Desulfobacteraceae bacterium]
MSERRYKGPLAWMAGNSVAANLLMLILLAGGLISALNIKQEVFPEFSTDTVSISVSYPGASPEEIEKGIILPVEEAVEGLEGIDTISSTASEGFGSVRVEALESTDIVKLWQEIETEVNRIDTFPDDAEEPKARIVDRKREVVNYVLYGSDDEAVLTDTAERIRDEFLESRQITQVGLSGTNQREIRIEIPAENLRKYGLTLQSIASEIRTASTDVGAGNIETQGGDILVRIKDLKEQADEYRNLSVITEKTGDSVTLGDIGKVAEGFEDSGVKASFNGRRALMIDIYRVGGQTPVQVARAAEKTVQRLNNELPGGLRLSVVRDRSDIFSQRAGLLLKNAYMGLGLVFILLAVFLEIRLAFWVSLGIPISFLGAFLIFPFTGFTVNMITMFAFIVTLGIVVDDAIVVGENVYFNRRKGLSFFESAVTGAREVAMPITFSVITNIVAFLPLYFVPGVMGKIFKFIPVVVTCVFFISLVESLFILPAHLAHQKKPKRTGILSFLIRMQEKFSLRFEAFVTRIYGPFVQLALKNKYMVIALSIAVLMAAAGYVKSGRMGMTLFPSVESDYAFASAVLPVGSSDKNIERVKTSLTRAAERVIEENGGDELSLGIFSLVTDNEISMRVFLTPAGQRPLSTTEFSRLWRTYTGQIPGLESISFESDRGGPGSGKGLTVRLSHPDKEILETAGAEIADKIADYDGVSDVDDGSARGKRQLDIRILPAGLRMGLTSREIGRQVRNALHGTEALSFLRENSEVEVMVSLEEEERKRESTLENLVLKAPEGEILLRNAASISHSRAFTSIKREDGKRVVSVTANVTPRPKAEIVMNQMRETLLPEITRVYPSLTYSFEGRQAEIRDSVSSLVNGLLFALLVIYSLLSIPFRSYFQPLIIMCAIPFGIIGAMAGHLIMGYSLSVMSLFGVVALSGVVVNDSLVLINLTNTKVRQGETVTQAIQFAAMQRFRPILLTTLTTFFGLMPMILETSRQARFLIPMAISLGFGIVFATFITLVMVPCFYLLTEDLRSIYKLVYPGEDASA